MNNIDLKEIIASHFDKKVRKNSANETPVKFGSESEHYLLRFPYLYMESVINDLSSKSKKILDYCCGAGIHSVYPSTINRSVDGIDISSESIKIASNIHNNLVIKKKLKFSVMDAENLEFEDNNFDIILSYNSLSYLNLNKSYKELSRVLKPEGKLIVMDSVGHNLLFSKNRKKNLRNLVKDHENKFQILKKDKILFPSKSLILEEIKYFGFLSVFLYFIEKKF